MYLGPQHWRKLCTGSNALRYQWDFDAQGNPLGLTTHYRRTRSHLGADHMPVSVCSLLAECVLVDIREKSPRNLSWVLGIPMLEQTLIHTNLTENKHCKEFQLGLNPWTGYWFCRKDQVFFTCNNSFFGEKYFFTVSTKAYFFLQPHISLFRK